jgi:Uma2 family endonuclease
MSQPQAQHYITEAEYLALEKTAHVRHEYVDGQIYAMAGAADKHNRVAMNIGFHLRRQTRGTPCSTYMNDMKLRLEEGRYQYYPDVMLCCDPTDNPDPYYKERPCVLVEVLSPSTLSTDKREKLLNYQRNPSVRYYLIVSPEQVQVDYYQRNTEGQWEHALLEAGETLHMQCGDCTMQLTLEDIYEDMGILV